MGIRASYRVDVIPDEYVTTKIVYAYIKDPDAEQEVGKPTKKIRTETVVEEKGGWLFTFPRGHQIRCTTEQQIKLLGLSTSPHLIDDTTGLQVNEHGIPLDIADHVKGAVDLMSDGGAPDTVSTLMTRRNGKASNPIHDAIDETE
jgi:hypothetical protein